MSKNTSLIGTISLAGLAVAALATWWSVSAQAADEKHTGHHDQHVAHLNHITTRAQAEALKPGDALAVACSKCKHVTVHHVTKDHSPVKLMTIGEKHQCVCGGTVTVVGTGKGSGKNEQVTHVCAHCGPNVMFACATKPGTGTQHDHAASKD